MKLDHNIPEMLKKAEITTDILSIAFDLQEDKNYTKEDAIEALLNFLEKHGLN